MIRLDQLHRDTPFDRFAACTAYAALEYDWNHGGWVRERPSNQRRRESIGVQLARIEYRAGRDMGGFSSLLSDEHEGARDSYVNALVAWGLARHVDPADELGAYIRATYCTRFLAAHFPQLVTQ